MSLCIGIQVQNLTYIIGLYSRNRVKYNNLLVLTV